MVDGSFVVATRPRCILSLQLLRVASLEVAREVNDRRTTIEYNKCFCNEYALRIRMKGMVECLE